MAKRMKFSVVGLPHYTIWHLYEPSVDDIRHMEEMENERKQREAEEKAKQDRMEKIQNDFDDGASQWARTSKKSSNCKRAPNRSKPSRRAARRRTRKRPATCKCILRRLISCGTFLMFPDGHC